MYIDEATEHIEITSYKREQLDALRAQYERLGWDGYRSDDEIVTAALGDYLSTLRRLSSHKKTTSADEASTA